MNSSKDIPQPIGIIGAGAVGSSLAKALLARQFSILTGTRHPERCTDGSDLVLVNYATVMATCEYVFLTVPDSVLIDVATASVWRANQCCIHCAGSQPAEFLADYVAPARSGAFHPLAAFPHSMSLDTQIHAFEKRVIAIDGPAEVRDILAALAIALGGIPLSVPPAARVGYHLAASMASNMLVALISQAKTIWTAAGLDPDLAFSALSPLLASTVHNLDQFGLPQALTGPIARGDLVTVQRHLEFLAATPAFHEIDAVYRLLGQEATSLARMQERISPALLDAIATELASDKND